MKFLAQGAEATITLDGDTVTKNRTPKDYRIKEIDEKLRTQRTRAEAKIIQKLSGMAPNLKEQDQTTLKLEHIQGPQVKEILDNQPELAEEIGQKTAVMHDLNIIHGDLTTSNMILGKELRIIDFGLSYISDKTEDKAVDLHVFREAVESKHYRKKDEIWKNFLKGYNSSDKKEILKRLEQVEKRGRNKAKY